MKHIIGRLSLLVMFVICAYAFGIGIVWMVQTLLHAGPGAILVGLVLAMAGLIWSINDAR